MAALVPESTRSLDELALVHGERPLLSPPPALELVEPLRTQLGPRPAPRTPARAALVGIDVLAPVVALLVVAATGTAVPIPVAVLLPLVWLALLAGTKAYRSPPAAATSSARLQPVLRAGAALAAGLWLLVTTTDLVDLSGRLLLVTAASTAVSGIARLVGRWRDSLSARRGAGWVPTVVVGSGPDTRRVMAELGRSRGNPFQVVSVCLSRPDDLLDAGIPARVGLEHLGEVVAAHGAEAVIAVPGPDLEARALQRLGWSLETHGTQLYVCTGLQDVAVDRADLSTVGRLPLVRVRPARRLGSRLLVKEIWERAAAAALLLVLLPLLVGLGLAVRQGSPGPAFFRQARVGKDGHLFTMFKLRTMTDGAEQHVDDLVLLNEADGVLFKVRQDPRVTPIGSTLRRWSLDELPQLINVALGQMSLVGPRPALPNEVAAYDSDPRRRLVVKPGLTGLWQVSGRSDLSWEDAVRLDLDYVDNWSINRDLAILGRTVRAVLSRHGAY